MSKQKTQFIALLGELFQLNQPELDFGLYRIIHARSAEIEAFIDTELGSEIDAHFADQSQSKAHDTLEAARVKVAETLGEDAFLPSGELKPEYRGTKVGKEFELAQQQARDGGGVLADDAQVYEHLYRFLSRYYDKGDFMSKRYFVAENDSRAAPYAVPYDGREVMLHWANKDQYYIKSSEALSNFTFDLTAAHAKEQGQQSGFDFQPTDTTPLKVHFRLAAATEGEHNSVKEGQERCFIIHSAEPLKLEVNENDKPELVVQFDYRPDGEKSGQAGTWQQKRLAEAEQVVAEQLASLVSLHPELRAFEQSLFAPAPTDKQSNRTLLGKYLSQFTARNTMDYFIHKNLGGFLRRELDFYIKNEIVRLDDIESADAPRVEEYLKKLRVLRKIARRIIDFLAQLEDFQKKLWLKKKFVVDTQYCIALREIPEQLLLEVAANVVQREEWVALCGIDKQPPDITRPNYSEPLTVEFLKAQPTLMIDTRHFDSGFRDRLLAALDGLDDKVDGVLVHSDNFQALSLMQAKYQSQIKTITIDPPYNRQSDDFPYKDNYKHSSWASMMQDRLSLGWQLLTSEGALFSNIDENERDALAAVLSTVFGKNNRIEELIWAQNTTHSQSPLYSTNHEYIEVYAKNRVSAERAPAMFREPKPGLKEVLKLVEELNASYPSIQEIEAALAKLYAEHLEQYKVELSDLGLQYNDETKKIDPWRGTYNYSKAEYRDAEGRIVNTLRDAKERKARIIVWQADNASGPAQKQSDTTKAPADPNYRFYTPIHPVTGIPCPHPKRGWAWPYEWKDSGRDSFKGHQEAGRISWGVDESTIPRFKRFLHEVETNVSKSFFHDYTDGEKQIAALFGQQGLFPTPKPTTLPAKFIAQTTGNHCRVLDFFGGSGTTGHAVINLNREVGSQRKFVLVEMSDYFDRILVNRLKKVAFAADWADGKPRGILAPEEIERSPRAYKILRVESFEDTLNNLQLPDTPHLNAGSPESADMARDYLLKYWLEFETAGSPSLLNVREFTDPTSYKLKVKQPGSDAQVERTIDLVETFNWLIGLHVAHLDQPRRYAIELVRETDPELPKDQDTRWRSTAIKERDDGEFWFRVVEGHILAVPGDDSSRERVLVIWRKLTGNSGRDQAALEAWLTKRDINPRESEFTYIYVNGNHALPSDGNAATRVRLIEETFAQRMWEDA
jgi:adenine-specific DNA-methyltransferase